MRITKQEQNNLKNLIIEINIVVVSVWQLECSVFGIMASSHHCSIFSLSVETETLPVTSELASVVTTSCSVTAVLSVLHRLASGANILVSSVISSTFS